MTFLEVALSLIVRYVLQEGTGRPGLPDWSLGFVDLQRGVAIAIGTMLLAKAGAYVSFKKHPFRLKKFFALFVIFIAIYILMK